MSIERTIWLLVSGFLMAVFVALLATWRRESRAKIPRVKPNLQDVPFNAALEREKARKIFEGAELQRALDAIAFLEKEQSDYALDEAQYRELDSKSQRFTFQLVVFIAFVIALGILYGLYKFANAP